MSTLDKQRVKSREDAIKENYEAFSRLLPTVLNKHAGQYALMRDCKIIEYFDTAKDAFLAGKGLYHDNLFSVQEITNSVVNLGYYSYAVPCGNAK